VKGKGRNRNLEAIRRPMNSARESYRVFDQKTYIAARSRSNSFLDRVTAPILYAVWVYARWMYTQKEFHRNGSRIHSGTWEDPFEFKDRSGPWRVGWIRSITRACARVHAYKRDVDFGKCCYDHHRHCSIIRQRPSIYFHERRFISFTAAENDCTASFFSPIRYARVMYMKRKKKKKKRKKRRRSVARPHIVKLWNLSIA